MPGSGVFRPAMASRWASRTANLVRSISCCGSFATALSRSSRAPAADTASSVLLSSERTVVSRDVASGQRCSSRALVASLSFSSACRTDTAACSGTCWRSCQHGAVKRRRSSLRTGPTVPALVVSAWARVRSETSRRSISEARSGSLAASARTASASRITWSARSSVPCTPCWPAPWLSLVSSGPSCARRVARSSALSPDSRTASRALLAERSACRARSTAGASRASCVSALPSSGPSPCPKRSSSPLTRTRSSLAFVSSVRAWESAEPSRPSRSRSWASTAVMYEVLTSSIRCPSEAKSARALRASGELSTAEIVSIEIRRSR